MVNRKMKQKITESNEHVHSTEKYDSIFPNSKEVYMKGQSTGVTPQNQTEEPKGPPIGGILSGILGILSIAAAYGWITGSWGDVETIATIIAVLIGGIAAFFMAETFGYTFLIIEAIGAVLLWIGAAIGDLVLEGFSISWIFTDIILGPIVTIPLCAFPALVCAILIMILKKLIRAFEA